LSTVAGYYHFRLNKNRSTTSAGSRWPDPGSKTKKPNLGSPLAERRTEAMAASANPNQVPVGDPPALARRDFRQEVTDRIINMLQNGVAPWQKPWNPADASLGMPMNPTTGKAYRGGNAIHLMATGLHRGYGDPRWMTYRQAAALEWQVRRGEKGTQIEFWEVKAGRDTRSEPICPGDGDGQRPADEPDEGRGNRLIHRVYTVFNAKQIEGIQEWTPNERSVFEVVEAAEEILKNSGATIRHDQSDRAFYNRSSDSIHMPPKQAFQEAAGYYGTVLHELAHWTGHPSRLDRTTLNETYRFGDISYAKEELRAELASVFLAAERGIPHDAGQHAAYVSSWIKVLKQDKHEIFRAAHDASAATDYLLALERNRPIADERLARFSADSMTSASPTTLKLETGDLYHDRERPGAIREPELSGSDSDTARIHSFRPESDHEAKPTIPYLYRHAIVAGRDAWKWQQKGTLVWATANTEREALDQMNNDAETVAPRPRLRTSASSSRAQQRSSRPRSVLAIGLRPRSSDGERRLDEPTTRTLSHAGRARVHRRL
jgi:antirestriction protein ArdC